ncbi:hypothetical protein FE844_028255 (plasmid) [Rhizobium indicum]|uniref:hypothetical protein n=1 Tax=Rhizobium indicum TaxID=2583231 RepID=UPI00110586CD|nr:hypothetical protein [Rhizobium indicum]QKK33426.1 hypothetical protein FE844_028255 [Rhizobium indicum]
MNTTTGHATVSFDTGEMIALGEPLAATIDRLYLEVEAAVPMAMEDDLFKSVNSACDRFAGCAIGIDGRQPYSRRSPPC